MDIPQEQINIEIYLVMRNNLIKKIGENDKNGK